MIDVLTFDIHIHILAEHLVCWVTEGSSGDNPHIEARATT